MIAGATSVERTALCPVLPSGVAGVRIAAAPMPRADSPLVLHGSYHLPRLDAERIRPPCQRALVLLVTRLPRCWVATPFEGRVLFADDEHRGADGARGAFTLDVFELQGSQQRGQYHLLVSLGPHVSNVVAVRV